MNKNRIKNALTSPAIIDTASDGSHDQRNGMMSYGWVVTINESTIAEGKVQQKVTKNWHNHFVLKHMV
jgi:hypothetical protein